MSTDDLGDIRTLGIEVYGTTNTLENAGSATVTITRPDGTVDGPFTASNPSTGRYVYPYTPVATGLHGEKWVTTAPNAAVLTRTFYVRPPQLLELFSLDDLQNYLPASAPWREETAKLARDLATGLVEAEVGPVMSRQSVITIPIDVPSGIVELPIQGPITAVTSALVHGAYSATFVWERPYPRIRLLSYTDGSWTSTYGNPWPTVDVTLTHGYKTPPGQVKAVALSVAARAYDNPLGVRVFSVDDVSETRAGSDDDLAGITLTRTELAALGRLVRGSYTTSA